MHTPTISDLPPLLENGASRERWISHAFLTARTVRQVYEGAFGPGEPRYGLRTITLIQERYPGLILGPYRLPQAASAVAVSCALFKNMLPQYQRTQGVIKIWLGLNTREKNYYLAREMFQILLDCEEFRVKTNPAGAILRMIGEWHNCDLLTCSPMTFSESLAEIAAVEFLYPTAIRRKVRRTLSIEQISERYCLPEEVVSYYHRTKIMALG